MSTASVKTLVANFVEESREVLQVPGAKAESSLYSQLEKLLTGAFELLSVDQRYAIIQQTNAVNIGIPDFRVNHAGELLGWIEFKAVLGKPLGNLKGHDAEQRDRFVNGLHNLIITNGWEWRLYQDGRQVGRTVVLGDPDMFDPKKLAASVADQRLEEFGSLIRSFLSSSLAPYSNAESAVTALATRAKGLKSALVEVGPSEAGENLLQLRDDFRDLLYKNGQPFSWEKFVDSYVQIAVFGTLLWRLESKQQVSLDRQVGVKFGVHPLLSQCLSILWSPQARLPVMEPLLEELCRTVNLIKLDLFSQASDAGGANRYVPDPIVHAYEPFFAVYDSAARDANGVYYTPVEIVEHIISGISDVLKGSLGRPDGLLDDDARFLDPATGTGTFLLGLANAVAKEAEEMGLPKDQAVSQVITERSAAFEIFPGPYTIAHQRVETLLEQMGAAATKRLPIYLSDTLAAPTSQQLGGSGFGLAGKEILKERQEADNIKTAEEILVILGNPPYERIRKANGGFERFANALMQEIVKATPLRNRADLKSATDLFVAFWAWSLWALQSVEERMRSSATPRIDTSGAHGVIGFITNRTWIGGPSLVGLRSLVRHGAKEVWVCDLGGDARGGAGAKSFAGGDANVFGIQTGVAIVWLVFDREWTGETSVYYRREYGSKQAKLISLRKDFDRSEFTRVLGSDGAPFIPVNWGNSILECSPSLLDLFIEAPSTGIQTARDTKKYPPMGTAPEEVYAESKASPQSSRTMRSGSLGDWAELGYRERVEQWSTAQSKRTGKKVPDPDSLDPKKVRKILYRPLDFRWVYDDPNWIDWYREDLHTVYRDGGVPALITLARDQGAGPTVIHSEMLMEQHAFKGSAGGKGVFPLWRIQDEQQFEVEDPRGIVDGKRFGFTPRVYDWLDDISRSDRYEDAYHYILAILSAPAYARNFWKALEVDHVRVPLVADPEIFDRAAQLGWQVRAAWNLSVPNSSMVKWLGEPTAQALGKATHKGDDILFDNGRKLVGVPAEVWKYSVSNYAVLPNWFKARQHWPLTMSQAKQALAVVSAASVLVDLQEKLDAVLISVIRE
ncbi:type ISP restriction/modification enzyme [Streptomyces nigra]|uniref:type ISP restriction/modification enzyme n=1 Tax=Streptomyces nigra TaxID=1827580 RepID=UPI00363F90D7